MLKRLYARSLLIAAGLVLLVGLVSSVERLAWVGVILLPGLLLAAIPFPGGIHSNAGTLYIALAAIFDVLVFAVLVAWILWRFQRRAR
jgi:ABC-type sulfate transport system permease component